MLEVKKNFMKRILHSENTYQATGDDVGCEAKWVAVFIKAGTQNLSNLLKIGKDEL